MRARHILSSSLFAAAGIRTNDDRDGNTNLALPPRLVFFGEQHHQPAVLRAQIQSLSALADACKASHVPHQLHLVLEQFALPDQPLLDAFSAATLSGSDLVHEYSRTSDEGFNVPHYLPLLLLARERGAKIWAGFPPRAWARQMVRQGWQDVQANEEERVNAQASTLPSRNALQVPLFQAWDSVRHLSAAHKSYINSLMHPDQAPSYPESDPGAPDNALAGEEPHQPPSSRTLVPPVQDSGFLPAQTLKDAFLAHTVAHILRHGDGEPSSDAPKQIRDVVLVICGAGHCEYGFGAPERVQADLRQSDPLQNDASQNGLRQDDHCQNQSQSQGSATPSSWSHELHHLNPLLIISKPHDSGLWLGTTEEEEEGQKRDSSRVSGSEQDSQARSSEEAVAVVESFRRRYGRAAGDDGAQSVPEHAREQDLDQEQDQTQGRHRHRAPTDTTNDIQRNAWIEHGWERKLGDAVVLYDWFEDQNER